MKKVLLSLSLVASLFASDKLLTQTKALDVFKHTPFYSQLKSYVKDKKVKIKGVEKKDFYILTLSDDKRTLGDLAITKDLKYTIQGRIIDNKKSVVVEPNYPADLSVVKDGVMFSIGHGKKELFVVTDPECPFCRKFEKEAEQNKLGERYTIHIIFLPLPFHKDAKPMVEYILSADKKSDQAKRFQAVLKGSDEWKNFKPTKAQKLKVKKLLEKSAKAVNELNVKGTPSFFDKDLNHVGKTSIFK